MRPQITPPRPSCCPPFVCAAVTKVDRAQHSQITRTSISAPFPRRLIRNGYKRSSGGLCAPRCAGCCHDDEERGARRKEACSRVLGEISEIGWSLQHSSFLVSLLMFKNTEGFLGNYNRYSAVGCRARGHSFCGHYSAWKGLKLATGTVSSPY